MNHIKKNLAANQFRPQSAINKNKPERIFSATQRPKEEEDTRRSVVYNKNLSSGMIESPKKVVHQNRKF